MITKPEKEQLFITLQHISSKHSIKATKDRILKFTDDQDLRDFLRNSVNLLIHTTELTNATYIFETILILFHLEYKTDNYNLRLQELTDVELLDFLEVEA